MTSALDGGGWLAPRPFCLYPRERPATRCTGGWVGSRTGLDRCGKSFPNGIRSLDLPVRSESLYRPRYPDSHYVEKFNVNKTGQTLRTDDSGSVFVGSTACPGPLGQDFVCNCQYVSSSDPFSSTPISYYRSCAMLSSDIVAK